MNPRSLVSFLRPLALGVGLALAAAPAWAGPPAVAPLVAASAAQAAPLKANQVELSLLVVHATEDHSRVDPKLKSLSRYLQHMRYTGFELLDEHVSRLTVGSSQSFSIEDGRKLQVNLLSKDEKRARLRVQIHGAKGTKLLDSTLSVNRNGTAIFGGPKFKDGVLVLPVSAKY